MTKLRKILFATDLSKNAEYGFSFVLDLVRQRKAELIVLHAIEPLPAIVKFHGTLEEENQYYEKVKASAKEAIGDLFSACRKKIEKETGEPCEISISSVRCLPGHPIEEILETADAENCDLIVMGSHGKGLLRATFLGSVSRSVLERSQKPVLIVPLPSFHADRDVAENGEPHQRARPAL